MDLFMILFAAILFFVLTPGIFVTLPPRSGKKMVAITHAIIFALVWSLSHKMVWNVTRIFEGMSKNTQTDKKAKKATSKPKHRVYGTY